MQNEVVFVTRVVDAVLLIEVIRGVNDELLTVVIIITCQEDEEDMQVHEETDAGLRELIHDVLDADASMI